MKLTQAEANRIEIEKQSEQRRYQLKRDEELYREVEKHEQSQREYCENQLRNLSKLVHEMTTLLKVPPPQVTILGTLDLDTPGR